MVKNVHGGLFMHENELNVTFRDSQTVRTPALALAGMRVCQWPFSLDNVEAVDSDQLNAISE
jgi:hypothetical protein